jgi:hypothetical protein
LRRERNKLKRRVEYAKKVILTKFPEMKENENFIQKHFEQKYGFKPPMPYSELIRRPRPDEIPKIKDDTPNDLF